MERRELIAPFLFFGGGDAEGKERGEARLGRRSLACPQDAGATGGEEWGFPLGVGAEINFGLRFAGTESRVGLWLGACLPK
jgi:hypothetical protein